MIPAPSSPCDPQRATFARAVSRDTAIQDARRELRRSPDMADALAEEIRRSKRDRWRSKTSIRANTVRHLGALVLRDLAGRSPVRERVTPGHWRIVANDDAGRRVLAAEMLCPVPRSFADSCAVSLVIRSPELFRGGEVFRRYASAPKAPPPREASPDSL